MVHRMECAVNFEMTSNKSDLASSDAYLDIARCKMDLRLSTNAAWVIGLPKSALSPSDPKRKNIFQVVGRRCVRFPTPEPISEPFGTSELARQTTSCVPHQDLCVLVCQARHWRLSGLRTTVAGVTCRPSSKRAELILMMSICQVMKCRVCPR